MAMMRWPRHDLQTSTIGDWSLHVYRRADALVVGPCMSLNHSDVEVMRFDLPPGKAHEHWAGIPGKPRLYYPRRWPLERCVELACSNLVEHATAAAVLAHVPPPDRADLRVLADFAAEVLT